MRTKSKEEGLHCPLLPTSSQHIDDEARLPIGVEDKTTKKEMEKPTKELLLWYPLVPITHVRHSLIPKRASQKERKNLEQLFENLDNFETY